MKKLMSIMLGLALVTGTVSLVFGQDEKKTEKKTDKKTDKKNVKKAKKTTEEKK